MEDYYYIPGTKCRYKISQNGLVYDVVSDRYLKIGRTSKNKYKSVTLNIDGVKSTKYIHRLLAELFIPNPENKPQVNHKDANPLNNSLDNLEWVTQKENIRHAWDNGLCKSWNAGTSVFYNGSIRETIYKLKKLGLTNKEIGYKIGIDKSAVSRILNNDMQKRSRRAA